MKELDVKAQSQNAYNQWCEQWREHAKIHSSFEMLSLEDFRNIGIGKAILLVANGYSLETEMETIKSKQHNVDIMCCDKTLGHLLDNGIKPKYCMVCDANVNYEKYMEPYKDQLDETILLMNVCANPKWSKNGNWEKKYFFVNKDAMSYEVEFCEISKCNNVIPAGTNVSNAMVIMATQSDNNGRQNFFGYDKILLIGFDYSWELGGKYYAYNESGDGKTFYMRHNNTINADGRICYTSNNLLFSSQWLEKYINTFNLPVVQCSKKSIMNTKLKGVLSEQIEYNFKREDCDNVKQLIVSRDSLLNQVHHINNVLNRISKDHHFAMRASV